MAYSKSKAAKQVFAEPHEWETIFRRAAAAGLSMNKFLVQIGVDGKINSKKK